MQTRWQTIKKNTMMGGGGFMQSMNNIVRNNRTLLKNNSSFKSDDNFKGLKENKSFTEKTYFKKASKEELKLLREKYKRENINQRRINIIAGIVLLIIISLITYSISKKVNTDKSPAEIKYKENKRTYSSLLNIADMNASRKDWNKAIEIYETLTELLPEKYVAHHRLIWALIQKCKLNNQDCIKAKKYIEKIKEVFPEKEFEFEKFEFEIKSLANKELS